MNSVDLVKSICKERRIPISKLERDLGYANGYIGQLRKGTFPSNRLSEIAQYLSVPVEYLMGGAEENEKAPTMDGEHFISDEDSLTQEEMKLVSMFRELTTQGKDYIFQQFTIALQIYTKKDSVPHMESNAG